MKLKQIAVFIENSPGRLSEVTHAPGWGFYPYGMAYMKTAGDHKPSMLIDIEMKRRTEIDFINGKFVKWRTGRC